MSLAGFKKQLNKANQLFNEKIAGARGTELDPDFMEMERKIDVAGRMVEDLIARTQEYLQPNPMARARMTAVKGFNNLQNKNKSMVYPQPEGILGESMVKHGKDLGSDSVLGNALVDGGEAYKQMAEIKYSLEDNVKQNFLDPFTSLQHREIKEINHHRKKLEGRRLDFDCKKRKAGGSKNPEEELRMAEEKFVESKNLAENAMVNFLNSDAEHIAALYEFVSSEVVYHQEAVRILSDLQQRLEEKRREAAERPKTEYVPTKPTGAGNNSSLSRDHLPSPQQQHSANSWRSDNQENHHQQGATTPLKSAGGGSTPSCRALYSFSAENSTELPFEEGDTIALLAQVDENWYEGEAHGRRGYFPVNYVEVLVPLP
ncbi:hypothetical protein BOX15_Mlig008239g2 [Macrostomum lignano]|uniref:SH3 domain-containing GRB2-like protein n=3 Tax=Macrostomum lignano TaxID=282301 RepID=A0A1I8GF11_9PLAT|nr:hypothetical protein BOX15_Mlig008239g2 [Macrostomum lignano]